MLKSFYLVFILFLVSATGLASQASDISDVHPVVRRHFNQESINRYLADKDFFYVETREAKTNYFQELKMWLFNMLRGILGSKASYFILGNLHYILIAIVLFLIIYKMGNLSLEKFGYRTKQPGQVNPGFDPEQIEEVDFQSLIKEAVGKNDYRMAIRYQYLDVLKNLSLPGLISHLQYKSNVEYLYELKDKRLKNKFRHLVFVFDHIWYGEYLPDVSQYEKFNLEFDSFKKQIPHQNGQKNDDRA